MYILCIFKYFWSVSSEFGLFHQMRVCSIADRLVLSSSKTVCLLGSWSKEVGVRTIETQVFKNHGKTSDTLGAAIMASASSGADIIATIHSEVGAAASNAATALLALLPQP